MIHFQHSEKERNGVPSFEKNMTNTNTFEYNSKIFCRMHTKLPVETRVSTAKLKTVTQANKAEQLRIE